MQVIRHIALSLVAFVVLSAPVLAQDALKQIPLTDKQVTGFIAAQAGVNAVISKIKGDKPDPKIEAELDAVAKKNGFANFADYDTVAGNIALVMSGIDPETKKFIGPEAQLKKEIAEVQSDNSIPAKEKTQILTELNEQLKASVPVENKGNIDLVMKYYDKLDNVK